VLACRCVRGTRLLLSKAALAQRAMNPTLSQKRQRDSLLDRSNNYIPLQQHLSTSFFASLHNNFPSFCCWQQQVFTSLPVSLHVIFDEAAKVTLAITIIAVSGSHLFSVLITSPPAHIGFLVQDASSLQKFYDHDN
jgi:hypothetical protein